MARALKCRWMCKKKARYNGWYYEPTSNLIYLSTSDTSFYFNIIYTIDVAKARVVYSVNLPPYYVAFSIFSGP